MFERFTHDARAVVQRAATHEAAQQGAARVEAEHLLLALAAGPDSATARLLAEVGLDHDGVLAALERETERSLAAVGVSAADFALPAAPRPAPQRTPRFGTSAKQALERSLRAAVARGDRRIVAPHLLLGVLRAQGGTVPRALAVADVDPVALATRTERLLDEAAAA
jgi:D-alanyl-D-alanine carboxypeptidase